MGLGQMLSAVDVGKLTVVTVLCLVISGLITLLRLALKMYRDGEVVPKWMYAERCEERDRWRAHAEDLAVSLRALQQSRCRYDDRVRQ